MTLPNYRIDFFNQLNEISLKEGVNFCVWIPKNVQLENISVNFDVNRFACIKFTLRNRVRFVYLLPFKFFRKKYFILEFSLKTFFLTLILAICKKPFLLWGHGNTDTFKRSDFAKLLLNIPIWLSKGFLAYTHQCTDDLKIRFPWLTTIVLNNSTDTRKIQKIRQSITIEKFRSNSVGQHTSSGNYFLVLGQLVPQKDFKFLAHSLAILRRKFPDIGLKFIGRGSVNIKNFDFVNYELMGELTDDSLVQISMDAKGILNPGRVGLVATDSFALKLPIITTARLGHGPEFSYLIDGKNAIITENNPYHYANAIEDYLSNPILIDKLKNGCAESANRYSIEDMSSKYLSGMRFLLNEKVFQ